MTPPMKHILKPHISRSESLYDISVSRTFILDQKLPILVKK